MGLQFEGQQISFHTLKARTSRQRSFNLRIREEKVHITHCETSVNISVTASPAIVNEKQ